MLYRSNIKSVDYFLLIKAVVYIFGGNLTMDSDSTDAKILGMIEKVGRPIHIVTYGSLMPVLVIAKLIKVTN